MQVKSGSKAANVSIGKKIKIKHNLGDKDLVHYLNYSVRFSFLGQFHWNK